MLEKTLESPLDSKKIKSVHSKGNESLMFTGRTEAEAPILNLSESVTIPSVIMMKKFKRLQELQKCDTES